MSHTVNQPEASLPAPSPTGPSPTAPSQDAPRSTPLRVADLVLTVLFLVAITIPASTMFFSHGATDVASTEQRVPSPFPDLVFRRIGPLFWLKTQCFVTFPQKFERWFDDRVGLRQRLIRCYSLAKVFGLTVENRVAVGNAGHDEVTVGREGWLYLAGSHIERDFRRTDPFTPEALAEWRAVLDERRTSLAAQKIGYAFFVAPNQQTIYPENMPRAMTRADRPSRLDQLMAEAAREPRLPVLDAREELIAGKARYQTYHQTDSHWNDYGGYLGYRVVMDAIHRTLPTSPTYALDAFDVTTTRALNQGDLVRSLNAPIDFSVNVVTLVPRHPRKAASEDFTTASGIRCYKSMNYSVERGRLVVFHDSFVAGLMPYLGEHFREVYYLLNYSPEVIAELGPDFVLEQIVERKLMEKPPQRPHRAGSNPTSPPPPLLEAAGPKEPRR